MRVISDRVPVLSTLKVCGACGGPLLKPSQIRYCSRECYLTKRWENSRPRTPPAPCRRCGEPVTKPTSVFCGRECFKADRTLPEKTCPICSATFSGANTKTTCSVACAAVRRRSANPKRLQFCRHCGIEIIAGKDSFQFCSRDCWHKFRAPKPPGPQTCEGCGMEFLSSAKRKYCGRACVTKAAIENAPVNSRLMKVTRICPTCNKEFYRPSKRVKYCSQLCAAKSASRNRRAPDRPCGQCGEMFHPARSTSKYCSMTCAGEFRRIERLVKNPESHMKRADRGGLPTAQYKLWRALGGMEEGWCPQYWMSPLGTLGEQTVAFLLDIALPALKLCVEADGRSHIYTVESDEQRDGWLRSQGWTVLRVSNEDILSSIDLVVAQIRSVVTTLRSAAIPPSPSETGAS